MEPQDIPDFLPESLPEGGPKERGKKQHGPHGPDCDCPPDAPGLEVLQKLKETKRKLGFELIRKAGRKAELDALDAQALKRLSADEALQEATDAIVRILREQTARLLKETDDPLETLLVTKALMDRLMQCLSGDAGARLDEFMDTFILTGKAPEGGEEGLEALRHLLLADLRKKAEWARQSQHSTMPPEVLERLAQLLEES